MTAFATPQFRTLLALTALTATGCQAFAPGFAEFGGERVRDMRDRAAQRDAMLELRLDLVLPALFQSTGVDCWLVLTDGGHSDPMVEWLTLSATQPEGKGALMVCNGARRFALGRGFDANRAIYEVVEPSTDQPLEALLNQRLAEVDPQRIAINDARSFAPADGLTASNGRWLRDQLAEPYADRLVSARPLAEDFLATILDVEAPLISESARLTALILEEVLSDRVVVAAGTSLADLDAAVRQRAASVHVDLPFPPRPVVYRPGSALAAERDMDLDIILQPGDLVFLSAGVRYMGYATRVGRWAYLLPSGEREAPDWVLQAVSAAADAADRAVAALMVGQSSTEALDAVSAAAGMADQRVAVDRVGRLAEGSLDPARTSQVRGAWRPQYRVADATVLSLTLESTVVPETFSARAFPWLTVDTVVVTANGVSFAVAPQRTPLLID